MNKKLLILIVASATLSATAQPTVNIVPFATGFNNGISEIAHAGDNRLFVAEQLGSIYSIDSTGSVNPTKFLDILNKVTPTSFSLGNEQGLLGLAFSPNYATDGYFYVNYTNKTGNGNSVIARYQVSANPDVADANSEQILMTIYQPFNNHNGGSLKFGSDGFLYCAVGDGGSFGDPDNRAQNPDSLLGKILRIDVSGGGAYTIPPSNPFVSGGGAPEIWALGVRNPWRMSFDRLTNDLWIADVGQDIWEEINFQSASSSGGENYGWRCYEANATYNTTGCSPAAAYTAPIHSYTHASTNGCAVTGGYVYRGTAFPDMYGYYFYSDFCNGAIYAISSAQIPSTAGTFTGQNFGTFGENNAGELFIGSQANGTVYRIVSTSTGIADIDSDDSKMLIYPVPNKGNFTVESDFKVAGDALIEIADVTGRIWYSKKHKVHSGINKIPIDFIDGSSGVYSLKILTEQSILKNKFELVK